MLHFITELATALRRGDLYLLNHGNFVQNNTILTYKKAFKFFHNNATLDAVMYVTKFQENHSPNNVTKNFIANGNFNFNGNTTTLKILEVSLRISTLANSEVL